MWAFPGSILSPNTDTEVGSTNDQGKGMRRKGGGEEVSREGCFYGGAFPQFSQSELSGDFLPKHHVDVKDSFVGISFCL